MVRTHLTLLPDVGALGPVPELRHRFDPVMAGGVPPHVTLMYPEEYDDLEALTATMHRIAAREPSIRLSGGRFEMFDRWVGLVLDDPDGDWTRLRDRLDLPSPIDDAVPHLTVVHPRTSERAAEAWVELEGRQLELDLVIPVVALTHTSPATGLAIEDSFDLGGEHR